MRTVGIAGIGAHPFGKHRDRSIKSLAQVAVDAALADAGVAAPGIQAAYAANAVAGLVTGQETVRGQVVLRAMGLGGIPVVNVENACAGASSALQQGWLAVAAGLYDCVLVVGFEKMTHPDRAVTFRAIASGLDVEAEAERARRDEAPAHSVFMETYATKARWLMERFGVEARDFAWIAAKNHVHAVASPIAQYRFAMTPDEVLADRMVVDPLTRAMCSPIGDGAAAVVLTADPTPRVRIAGFGMATAAAEGQRLDPVIRRAADAAWQMAGIGPEDVDVAEVHDATASAELQAYDELSLAPDGDVRALVRTEATQLGGRIPVNTGGGLECRGHPVGATGLAQVVELTAQLRGTAGERQVEGARVAVAQNAGGHLGEENAVSVVTVLTR
ncbi:MAG: thiolase family protein [Myxococcota bacterium]